MPAEVAGTLYERLGGKTAVDAVVELFYTNVLADERIARFFEHVDLTKLKAHQAEFLSSVLSEGALSYSGESIEKAHARLIEKEGLNETHFDAVAEDLVATLKEAGVSQGLIGEVAEKVLPLRAIFESKTTLLDKLGGPSVIAMVVDDFYQRILADDRINDFFEGVELQKLRDHQASFMNSVLSGNAMAYAGKSIEEAHEKLVREQGLNETHFDAIAEDLSATLNALSIPDTLAQQVLARVTPLRKYFVAAPSKPTKPPLATATEPAVAPKTT
mmetsp:Transcript_43199/g.106140  ORF Transcript_43199/g.106140 Transcript_43199/m.106140 type:complete len:273 (-) Transcript_43199:47-865(-)